MSKPIPSVMALMLGLSIAWMTWYERPTHHPQAIEQAHDEPVLIYHLRQVGERWHLDDNENATVAIACDEETLVKTAAKIAKDRKVNIILQVIED